MVDGLYPQQETETSFIPGILLKSLHIETLVCYHRLSCYNLLNLRWLSLTVKKEILMEKCMAFSSQIVSESVQQSQRESGNHANRASSQEEKKLAEEVVSKCIIIMTILSEYPNSSKVMTHSICIDFCWRSQITPILRKKTWTDFIEHNVASIEILNESKQLQRVNFYAELWV